MPIVMRNMAQVSLPEEYRSEVLSMYLHESRSGDTIKNYKYSNGVAYLPLNIRKLNKVSELLSEPIVDERTSGNEVATGFTLNPAFKFRDHQAAPAQELLNFCKNNKYAVLEAPCSCGKTVVMTWVAGMLGRKVLVLVDMGSLQGQWQEAFKIVWNKESHILDKNSTTLGDVCIATFQMLHYNPELVNAVRKEFGTIVLDEYHGTQSTTRREVMMKLNSKYRIGCTATMMKKNYSDDVLTDMVADVSVRMVDKNSLKAEVFFLDTGVKFSSSNPDDWGKIQSKLGKDAHRNRLVAGVVADLYKEGRTIAVVCVTIDSCNAVAAELNKICPECKLRVYIGSTNLKQDQALRADMANGTINVVITVKKLDRGVDLPSLDALVLAKPANNEAFVVQVAGRVVRPLEGKLNPVIYDLVDRSELSLRFASNRRRWYRKLGYPIQKDIDK